MTDRYQARLSKLVARRKKVDQRLAAARALHWGDHITVKMQLARQRRVEKDIKLTVGDMYQRRYSWQAIAAALGISPEEAHQRYQF